MKDTFSHLDERGEARMVDVSRKASSHRSATARAYVEMSPSALTMLIQGEHKKGDAFAVARIAGIQAAKKCADLIPLCHPLMLDHVQVELTAEPDNQRVCIEATCALAARTGVEMEALTAVSVAALTLYDMCKAVDKGIVIRETRLIRKTGGKSGDWSYEP